MTKTLAIIIAACAMLVACGGQPTPAQQEKNAFDQKCRANPTLQECKDWKDQMGGGPG